MPTYVYACSACEKQFEVDQRITEEPLNECRCGSKGTVKRIIQPIAVMFKGSGFHINDYSGPPSKTDASSSGESTTTTEHATPPASAESSTTAASPKTES